MIDALPDDFDPSAYLKINSDVANAGLDPVVHYLRYGRAEGRAYRIEPAEEAGLPDDFDPSTYLKINPDVAEAGHEAAAHYLAFGRAEGRLYYRLTPYVPTISDEASVDNPPAFLLQAAAPKVIAFYLPQYHRVAENDLWWGEGFTEWTNVKKAKPNIVGHMQPHTPLGGNYYDLLNIDVHAHQANLAQRYGVHGFCYYMYWFNGRRILEKPLDMRINDSTIDMPFCICWANENWTRTWDGRAQDILLEQLHSPESDRQFIRDALRYLADPRYLRVDGKLLFAVYRVDLIPDCMRTAEIWREEVRKAGLGEMHLCAIQFSDIGDPRPFGFDAAIEFPPHGWLIERNLPAKPHRIVNSRFRGHVFDYKRSVDYALQRPYPDYRWYRGAFPGWDNTPRRQNTPHMFIGETRAEFGRWLTGILRQQIAHLEPEHQIVFINAWNEWGEGAHLEPDEARRYENLETLQEVLDSLSPSTFKE